IDLLLSKIGCFFERLFTTCVIENLVALRIVFPGFSRLKKIVHPLIRFYHPLAPVVALSQEINVEKSDACTSDMTYINGGFAICNACEINKRINHGEHPKRNAAIDHWKNSVVGRNQRCCYCNSHD